MAELNSTVIHGILRVSDKINANEIFKKDKPILSQWNLINDSKLTESGVITTNSGKTYLVRFDKDGNLSVNVPWTDTNTWQANTKDQDGYVTKGSGHANQVWKTDSSGVPGWRDDVDTTKIIKAYEVTDLTSIKSPKNGDIAIVKTPITANHNELTAYVYDTAWKALDGNYSAENVYFKNDLTFTYQFGKYTPNASTGQVKVPAADKNIKEFFLNAFAVEKEPTIIKPSISLSVTQNSSAEVGTYFSNPSAKISFSTGSYSYGSVDNAGKQYSKADGTGITFTTSTISLNDHTDTKTQAGNASYTLTAALSESERQYTDSAKKFTFSATAAYPASSRYPLTNLGNKLGSKNIASGSSSASGTFTATGVRKSFRYVGTDSSSPITNAWIRTNGTQFNGKGVGNLTIPAGTQRILVAIPGTATLKSVIDVEGMGLDQAEKFTTITLDINGANGYTAKSYTVFYFENSNGLAATHYNFTIV